MGSRAIAVVAIALLLAVLTAAQPQTSSYPGFCRESSVQMTPNSGDIRAMVGDLTRGMAYAGLVDTAQVVSFNLNTFSQGPTTDTTPYSGFLSAGIDPTHGNAYFGTATTGTVVRVSQTTNTMTGALDLGSHLSPVLATPGITVCMINPVTNMGYFSERDGALLSVNLATFAFVSRLYPVTGDLPWRTGVIDTTRNLGYFASRKASNGYSYILRVDLSTFTVTGMLNFTDKEFVSSVIHPDGNTAYFSSQIFQVDTLYGVVSVVRVNLQTFTQPRAADIIIMPLTTAPATSAMIDTVGNTAFFGTDAQGLSSSSSIIVPITSNIFKVNLTTFTVVGDTQLNVNENRLFGALADSTNRFGYILCRGNLKMVKLRFDPVPCNYGNCSTCRAGCGCGWCGVTQRCEAGDQRGAYNGVCRSGDSAWDYYQCYDCAAAKTCDACAAIIPGPNAIAQSPEILEAIQNMSMCGFCNSNGQCARANSSGIMPGAGPTCAVQAFDYQTCPECGMHENCTTCLSDPKCGWCGSNNTCVRGDNSGPYRMTCPAKYSKSACPSCASHSNCSSCIRDSDCGWCAESVSCVPGGDSAPFGASCARYHRSECPNCAAFSSSPGMSSCNGCLTNVNCTWCPATGVCSEGNATLAWGSTCTDVDFGTCASCSSLTSCGSCSANPDCGWCAASQTCMRGNTTGPYGAVCMDWEYSSCINCSTAAPGPYSANSTCATCNAIAGCAYCAITQTCMRGGPSGPYTGSCPSDWQDLDSSSCPPCGGLNCRVCAVTPECGYCSEQNMCMPTMPPFTAPSSGSCQVWTHGECHNCSSYTSSGSCGSCVADSKCGYCGSTGQCINGGSSGSLVNGSCPASDWQFASCAPCSYASCDACTADPQCGWCATTNRCAAGTSSGPSVGTCADWDTTCPNCQARSNCTTCAQDPKCGWCPAAWKCLRGTATTALEMSCPANTYSYHTCLACPAASGTSCTQCNATAGCGWCTTDQSCRHGNGSAPYDPAAAATCTAWNQPSCPACNAATTCASCSAMPACGWCASTAKCMEGVNAGPLSPNTCPNWRYKTCVGCALQQDCASCLATPGCGHCRGTASCSDGTISGPTSGTCAVGWNTTACPVCSAHKTCGTCTADVGCGWCADTGTCTDGGLGATCPAGFTTSTCPDCASETSCGGCSGVVGCGWCSASGTCIDGTRGGPLNSTKCNAAYDYGNCNVANNATRCSAQTTCDGCMAYNTTCGWCASTGTCHYGPTTPLVPGTTICPAGHYDTGTCKLHCDVQATCDACVAASSTLCGWCSTTGNCSSADAFGSAVQCPTGSVYVGSCMVDAIKTPDPCAVYSSCTDCADRGCGWNDDGKKCETQSITGTSSSSLTFNKYSCPNWVIAWIVIAVLLCLLCIILLLLLLCCRKKKQPPPPVDEPKPKPASVKEEKVAVVEETPLIESPQKTGAAPVKSPEKERVVMKSLIPLPYAILGAKDSVIDANQGQVLADMETIILRPDMHVVDALCACVRHEDHDDLARALVCVFEASHVALPLVRHQITAEVAATDMVHQPNTLFRTNSLASKMMKDYAAIKGLEYQYKTLRPIIEDEVFARSILEPAQTGAEGTAQDAEALIKRTDEVFKTLQASAAQFPRELRDLCAVLLSTVSGVSDMGTEALAGFYMLRFITPTLVAPYTDTVPNACNIYDQNLPDVAQKNLRALVKTLQALATGVPFSNKNSHLAGCNDYIMRKTPIMAEFLHRLAGDVVSPDDIDLQGNRRGKTRYECVVPPETPAKVRDEALVVLANLLSKYEDDIRKYMGAIEHDQSYHLVATRKPFDHLRMEIRAPPDQRDDNNLLEILLAPDLSVASALCDVATREQQKALTYALMAVFEAHNSGQRLVMAAAERELRNCTMSNTVFKEFHMAAQLMSRHANMVGSDYRRSVVGKYVQEVINHPQNYEVDPSLVAPPRSASKNMNALLEVAGNLLEDIFNSLGECPPQMRVIADHLAAVVRERFEDEWYLGPGRYFFQRFMCEALLDPSLVGAAEVPSPEAARALHLLSQIVGNLVNGMQFNVQHRQQRALNEFLASNQHIMREFLNELAKPLPQGPPPVPAPVTPEEQMAGLDHLRYLLEFYLENADFCYYYHYYFYYHTDASDEEENYYKKQPKPEMSAEARTFLQLHGVMHRNDPQHQQPDS